MKWLTVSMALALAAAGWADTARTVAGYPVANVTINDEPVKFHSWLIQESMPALLVDGRAMLPARMFPEWLGDSLDRHVLEVWGVFGIGPLEFKVGQKKCYRRVPYPGGGAAQSWDLPVAPKIINIGSPRLYVPAATVLHVLGHEISWRQQTRTLEITRRKRAEMYRFY